MITPMETQGPKEPAIRVQNLRRLVEQAGGPASFSRKHLGIDPTYVSQLLNGHRNFGERAARNMEDKMGVDRGFLDLSPADGISPAAKSLVDTATRLAQQGKLSDEQAKLFEQLLLSQEKKQ